MTLQVIKEINKKLALFSTILVIIVFRDFNLVMAYILGLLASVINFEINIRMTTFDLSKNVVFKSIKSFIMRMLVYAIVLTLSYKVYNEGAMILTFIGCLSIRVSIFLLLFTAEGGDLNE